MGALLLASFARSGTPQLSPSWDFDRRRPRPREPLSRFIRGAETRSTLHPRRRDLCRPSEKGSGRARLHERLQPRQQKKARSMGAFALIWTHTQIRHADKAEESVVSALPSVITSGHARQASSPDCKCHRHCGRIEHSGSTKASLAAVACSACSLITRSTMPHLP